MPVPKSQYLSSLFYHALQTPSLSVLCVKKQLSVLLRFISVYFFVVRWHLLHALMVPKVLVSFESNFSYYHF